MLGLYNYIIYVKYMVSIGLCVCMVGGGGKKHLPPRHYKKGLRSLYIKIIYVYLIILYSIYHMEYRIRGRGCSVVGLKFYFLPILPTSLYIQHQRKIH